jgi:putative transcriptional regulator
MVKEQNLDRGFIGDDMKYKSEIFEVVHQDAIEMFKIGAISEAEMREYDELCLVQDTETNKVKSAKEAEIAPQPDLVTV